MLLVRTAGVRRTLITQIEDGSLTQLGILLNLAARSLCLGKDFQHPRTRGTGRVEGTALDERLDRLLVDATAVDALAEIPDRDDRPARLARLDDGVDSRGADVLYGVEPEADVAFHDHEVVTRLVHVGRQHLDSHFLAARDEERD